MGIKGIYRELGLGRRVSLSALAAESLDKEKRPLRLAIDIAIWQFQSQAARGGANPAIRNLFYRLVRLLGTPIQPVFVFDGPSKPRFKRNKRSGRGEGTAVAVAQAKRMIRLFGFVAHDAPGEAEAECAYLQRNGIVDAVLSEDVDTIMFGCTRTLRNWSVEGASSSAPPTHVSLYDAAYLESASPGMGRDGMVLVALMSGGDYVPDGVPGCGLKVACEAARGGFGASLCRLKVADAEGIRRWRETLVAELRTNESGFFRTRHRALAIPDDFPNMEVLRYYTHPVVSPPAALEAVAEKLRARRDIQLGALREFAREVLDWEYRGGALKFVRVLGRAMLVQRLLEVNQNQGEHEDENGGEQRLVHKITCRRTHLSCDGTPEMRLSFTPGDAVPIDLSKEVDADVPAARDGLALNSDDEFDAPLSSSVPGSSQTKTFDPAKPELAWVLEGIVRRSLPRLVRSWEDAQAAKPMRPSKPLKAGPGRGRGRPPKPAAVPHGSLDRFTRVTKPKDAVLVAEKKLPPPPPPPPPPPLSLPHAPAERALSKAAMLADGSTRSSPISHRPRAGGPERPAGSARESATSRSAAAPGTKAGEVAAAGDGRVARAVCAVLPEGGQPQELRRLKQSRMDAFVAPRPDQVILVESDDEAAAPSSSQPVEESTAAAVIPKKKMIVPRPSGSFAVEEVDADEREARLTKQRGLRAQRWSEVEILDLS